MHYGVGLESSRDRALRSHHSSDQCGWVAQQHADAKRWGAPPAFVAPGVLLGTTWMAAAARRTGGTERNNCGSPRVSQWFGNLDREITEPRKPPNRRVHLARGASPLLATSRGRTRRAYRSTAAVPFYFQQPLHHELQRWPSRHAVLIGWVGMLAHANVVCAPLRVGRNPLVHILGCLLTRVPIVRNSPEVSHRR